MNDLTELKQRQQNAERELQALGEEIKRLEQAGESGNVLFTPAQGGRFYVIVKSVQDGEWLVHEATNCNNLVKNAYRTEEAAQLVCDANNVIDEFAAMGEGLKGDGVYQHFVDWSGRISCDKELGYKALYKGHFPTKEAVQKALEAIGGWEVLRKARIQKHGVDL